MGSKRRNRLVHLVEVAYDPAPSIETWVEELTRVSAELLPESEGVVSRLVELEPRRSVGYAIDVRSPAVHRALREHEARSAHRVDILLWGPSVGLRRLQGDAGERAQDPVIVGSQRRFEALGIGDMHHLTAFDGRGYCLTLGIMMRKDGVVAGSKHSWTRAGIHFASAFRLQRRAFDLLAELPQDGAVLDPDGRVIDAHGEATDPSARERLRETVRAVDAARARSFRDGDERALEVWQGLVDGTWSIVDRHDHDGRRFVIAVPNRTGLRDPRGLSPREAQVAALAADGYSDKWIGYALGLTRTTVATHLESALRKLGLASRVALTNAMGPASHTAVA